MTTPARAFNVTATAQVYTGPARFRGVTVFSTAGATVTVYDGTGAAGTILAKFVLAANGDRHIDIADGIQVDAGVHLVASAAIEGNVRIG